MADVRNDGGRAFPVHPGSNPDGGSAGMSLRDWFAGQALSAIMRAYRPYSCEFEQSAKHAYEQADAMLRAREVKP